MSAQPVDIDRAVAPDETKLRMGCGRTTGRYIEIGLDWASWAVFFANLD